MHIKTEVVEIPHCHICTPCNAKDPKSIKNQGIKTKEKPMCWNMGAVFFVRCSAQSCNSDILPTCILGRVVHKIDCSQEMNTIDLR